MKTEKEKMLSGELYDPGDPQLTEERRRAQSICFELRSLNPKETERKEQLLNQLFGKRVTVSVTQPFFCDYGHNIEFGENVYFNFNCVVLDIAPIKIGNNVLFGPGVHIYSVTHPLSPEQRITFLESGKPVTINDDVWVGGGAIICPGVTIGEGAVIGAGSVVVKDIPPRVLAVGNPCRVVRDV